MRRECRESKSVEKKEIDRNNSKEKEEDSRNKYISRCELSGRVVVVYF